MANSPVSRSPMQKNLHCIHQTDSSSDRVWVIRFTVKGWRCFSSPRTPTVPTPQTCKPYNSQWLTRHFTSSRWRDFSTHCNSSINRPGNLLRLIQKGGHLHPGLPELPPPPSPAATAGPTIHPAWSLLAATTMLPFDALQFTMQPLMRSIQAIDSRL